MKVAGLKYAGIMWRCGNDPERRIYPFGQPVRKRDWFARPTLRQAFITMSTHFENFVLTVGVRFGVVDVKNSFEWFCCKLHRYWASNSQSPNEF